MTKKDVNVIVRVPTELYLAMKEKTDETGIAYSFVVRRALENWVATGTVPARVATPGKSEAAPAVGKDVG